MVLAQYGLNDKLAVAGAEVLKRKPALDAAMPSTVGKLDGVDIGAVVSEGTLEADGVQMRFAVHEAGSASIINCRTDGPYVAVPDEVGGCPVVAIGAHAFSTCYGLQEVCLPGTLAEVGEYAFMNCALKAFQAPAGLKAIGKNAFYKCNGLEQAALNEGLLSIGENAFRETSLKALCVPASVSRIGIDAFKDTDLAFSGTCPTFALGKGSRFQLVEGGLYRRADSGLQLLQLLDDALDCYTGPRGLVQVGDRAFAGKKALVRAVFQSGLESIGECAFKGCASLEEADMPDTLREIGKDAFRGTALRRLRVPAALQHAGLTAFYTGGSVASRFRRTIEDVSVAPGNDAFYVVDGMLCERRGEAGDLVLLYTGTGEEIVIPREVTAVGSYAFLNVTGARRLVLHSNVESVDVGGFDFGSALAEIVYDDLRTGERWVVRYPPGEQGKRALWLTFGGGDFDLAFAYDAADNAVLAVYDTYLRSRAMVERLCDPVLFEGKTAAEYRKRLRRALAVVVVEFGRNGYLQGVDELYDLGLLTDSDIDGCIEAASDAGEVALLSRLMEIKRTHFGAKLFDFDL